METKLFLFKELFSRDEKVLLSNNDFTVFGFKYESGIEAIKICNKKDLLLYCLFMVKLFGMLNLVNIH